jgi:hypothetical protein
LALAACAAPEASDSQVDAAERFADVDIEGIAKCVRANATEGELLLLDAGGAIAQEATRAILQRPATGDCIIAADVNLPRAG